MTEMAKGVVVIDSLPYIDGVHEGYEAQALALIQSEIDTTTIQKNHHHRLHPKLSRATRASVLNKRKRSSDILQGAYESLSENLEGQQSTSGITSAAADAVDKDGFPKPPKLSSSAEEWKASLRLARARYEAERQRTMRLECEKSHTTAASTSLWKRFMEDAVKPVHDEWEMKVTRAEASLNQIHQQRQDYQTSKRSSTGDNGVALQRQMTRYQELLQTKFHLQMATAQLEDQVSDLKGQVEKATAATGTANEEDATISSKKRSRGD